MSSASLSQVLSSSMVFIFSPFLCKELTISLFSTMLLSIKLSIIWASFLVYKCRFSLFVLTGQNFSICAGITTSSSIAAYYIPSSLSPTPCPPAPLPPLFASIDWNFQVAMYCRVSCSVTCCIKSNALLIVVLKVFFLVLLLL